MASNSSFEARVKRLSSSRVTISVELVNFGGYLPSHRRPMERTTVCDESEMGPERPELRCIECKRAPEDIPEYTYFAGGDDDGSDNADFVWAEEGTLNKETGFFACDPCYKKLGLPSGSEGWRAGDPIH